MTRFDGIFATRRSRYGSPPKRLRRLPPGGARCGPAELVPRRHWGDFIVSKKGHISETPATKLLKAHHIGFTEHPYEYLDHGGAQHSASVLGLDPFTVVKTLVMQDQDAIPLLVLMHGNRTVSTKNLARQIGAKSVEPCKPEVAMRHSGYLVGGTSPFATRKAMPVFIESSILALPKIAINGGRRGYLVGLDPQVCVTLLGAKTVNCALSD